MDMAKLARPPQKEKSANELEDEEGEACLARHRMKSFSLF
jgi:hypothetical protein